LDLTWISQNIILKAFIKKCRNLKIIPVIQ